MKTWIKENKTQILTVAIPLLYFLFMLKYYLVDYYVPDFRSYCGAATNGAAAYDGFSSLFLTFAGIATLSPGFINLLSLFLLALSIFIILQFFEKVFCKTFEQFLLFAFLLISSGFWYYFYGKLFYDWPYTIFSYSLCLHQLGKIIEHNRNDILENKDWYVFILLLGFMLSWKPYNIFLLAGLGLNMLCLKETRLIIFSLAKEKNVVVFSLILFIVGYVVGNYNLLLNPIGTLKGIKAYSAHYNFYNFMFSKDRIVWDQICDLPFNISVINKISLFVILFLLPLFMKEIRYIFVSYFMSVCLYFYITYFSPGLVWHGFAYGGFVVTLFMFLLREWEHNVKLCRVLIYIAIISQLFINFIVYIPLQNRWHIETLNAIKQLEKNEELIANSVLNIAKSIPEEDVAVDCLLKRYKPINVSAMDINLPNFKNTYFCVKNRLFVNPLWNANYSFWNYLEKKYKSVNLYLDSKYYVFIVPNAFFRIGDVADLNKYGYCKILDTIYEKDFTVFLYEKD